MSIEIVLVSTCNAFVEVALYASATCRSACPCIDLNLVVIVLLPSFSFVDVYHAIASCESIDLEIAKYMCFLVANERLQVLPIIICDARCLIASFASICRKCDLNRSLLSNWTPSILMSCLTSTLWLASVTPAIMSYLFDVLVKWISSCFRFANFDPCFCAHCLHLLALFY